MRRSVSVVNNCAPPPASFPSKIPGAGQLGKVAGTRMKADSVSEADSLSKAAGKKLSDRQEAGDKEGKGKGEETFLSDLLYEVRCRWVQI